MYDGLVGAFDSFRVEEAYNWRDDVMEITRRIVHETDEARLNNIAEHFKVDLSEIREFLEMKRKKMQKPRSKADRIRAMTDEELAVQIAEWNHGDCPPIELCPKHRNDVTHYLECTPWKCWVDWLREEATDD